MWAIPRPQLYCDIIGQKKKEVCLNLLLNLLNWSLIVNTICIPENTGNIHIKIIFFIPFLDADCNRFLWIYKITRFSYCFGNWWVVVMPVVRGGGVDVRFWTFSGGGWRLPKSNKCEQGGGASKFWSFCENVIVECPLSIHATINYSVADCFIMNCCKGVIFFSILS